MDEYEPKDNSGQSRQRRPSPLPRSPQALGGRPAVGTTSGRVPAAVSGPTPATNATGKRKSLRGDQIALIAIVVPLIAVVAFMVIRQVRSEAAHAQWVRQAAGELIFTPVQRINGEPSPHFGKAVMLDVDTREQYSSHLIPQPLQAATREELKTVIWCRNQDTPLGAYKDLNAVATQRSCYMTAVDLASHKVIDSKTFNWGPPPKSIPTTWGGIVVGDPPSDAIAQWINGMP